jgi:hypothetical protein
MPEASGSSRTRDLTSDGRGTFTSRRTRKSGGSLTSASLNCRHLATTGIAPDKAAPDALGFAVASALAPMAEPRRVVHFLGDEPAKLQMKVYDQSGSAENRKRARELFVEYVPPGLMTAGSGWRKRCRRRASRRQFRALPD